MRTRSLLVLTGLLVLVPPLAAQVVSRGTATSRDGMQLPPGLVPRTTTVTNSRAMIGVTISMAQGDHGRYGALIESVTPKGPADKAGIKAGDIITSVNKVTVLAPTVGNSTTARPSVEDNLISTLSRLTPGKDASIGIRRDGKERTIKVKPVVDTSRATTTVRFDSSFVMSQRMFEDALQHSALDSATRVMARRYDSMYTRQAMRDVRELSSIMSQNHAAVEQAAAEQAAAYGRSLVGIREALGQNITGAQRIVPQGEWSVPVSVMSTSVDALSRLELAALNPELGAYFGTREGVLVLAVNQPGALTTWAGVVPSEVRVRLSGAMGAQTPPASPIPPASLLKRDFEDAAPDVMSLRAGDVITAVDGRSVTSPAHLLRVLRSYRTGEEIKLSVHRQQKAISVYTRMPE